MSLEDAAKAARAHADVCTDWLCHMKANALEGAQRAEEDAVLLSGLTEPDPGVPFPPWRAVSAPDTT
ncbi:MAG TPA: hypothetical protein VMU34_08000 [Mycobacterium sp.]|nr:hypothetical protein [Mycobacterium sp.]